jgi:branched-chain amino acid aminotransferase
MIKSDIAWMNGKLVPFADAKIHITTHSLHYGLASFEGIRCYKRADGRSAVFRLREHIERLLESAKIATTDVTFSRDQLEQACIDTLKANKLEEAYIRPLVYLGAGVLGLGATSNPVDVSIITFPWEVLLGQEAIKSGIRACVSSYVRGHLNHTMSKGKISGQYVNSVLAKREAQRLGFEEGIMLDSDGRVCEGTGENIFIMYKGKLMTPPLVYCASEVFMTGTASEVTPVREIDARPIGDGSPGPVTRKLQQAFYAMVRGPGESHPEWLRYY